MLPTPKEVRAKSFEEINRDILTDYHRQVLARALKSRYGLCAEDFYFNPDLGPSEAWSSLKHWGMFTCPKDRKPNHILTHWRLSRMGAALAHYIAKQDKEAA
jgi:hypothetical protein